MTVMNQIQMNTEWKTHELTPQPADWQLTPALHLFCGNCFSPDWILMMLIVYKSNPRTVWEAFCARLVGKTPNSPPKEGRRWPAWTALTCNCPTPFPHLNALSNHRRGCCCYNPVASLWCGDIWGEKTGVVPLFFPAESDTITRPLTHLLHRTAETSKPSSALLVFIPL